MATVAGPRDGTGELRELEELLAGFDTALMTTVGADGHLHTRPMAMSRGEGSGELWFVSSDQTQKISDLARDPRCALAFHEGRSGATYVSLSGRAEVVRDRQKALALWEPSWKAWFPQGPDQPDLVLIRFVPEQAEYVHPKGGRLKVLLQMARNALTGRRAEAAPKRELHLGH